MKPTNCTAPRIAAASALVALLAAPLATAATLTWDPGHTPIAPSGTTGAWNTTTADWSDGAADQIWNTDSATADIAKFNVPSNYIVSLNSAINAGGLETAGTGSGVLTVSGSGSITLNGPATIAAVRQIDLGVTLQGSSGLVKSGVGVLRLTKAAAYSGGTSLTAGQLTLGVNNALPAGTTLTMSTSTFFTLSGFQQTIGGLASASPGNGTVRNTSGTSTLTISGSTTDTFSGTLSSTGVLNLLRSGTGVSIIAGTNTYTGTTAVSGGELRLGSNLANTSSVTVSGGTLSSTVTNVNLGLGAFSMSAGTLSPNATSLGSFTLANNQNFSATGGTFDFTLGADDSSDRIIGSGTGTFTLSDVTLSLSGVTSVAGTYALFSGFFSGSVSDITITGLASDLVGTLGTDGVLTVAQIPEPSAFAALAGLGALGLAALRRRR